MCRAICGYNPNLKHVELMDVLQGRLVDAAQEADYDQVTSILAEIKLQQSKDAAGGDGSQSDECDSDSNSGESEGSVSDTDDDDGDEFLEAYEVSDDASPEEKAEAAKKAAAHCERRLIKRERELEHTEEPSRL